MKHRLHILLVVLLAALGTAVGNGQTVIDMRTGRVSGKTTDDYNYQAREAWQLREDSIAYNDCVTRGFNFLHADSLQAAQNLFEKALKLRPDAPGNSVLRHNIGRIFLARRQWRDAISILSRVVREQPRNVEVIEDRATCYVETGQWEKALSDYAILLTVRPDDERFRLMHAMMLGHTGERLDAIDELDALLGDKPDYAAAYLLRANLYTDLGKKGFARRDLDRAVALGVPKDEILDLYKKLK